MGHTLLLFVWINFLIHSTVLLLLLLLPIVVFCCCGVSPSLGFYHSNDNYNNDNDSDNVDGMIMEYRE